MGIEDRLFDQFYSVITNRIAMKLNKALFPCPNAMIISRLLIKHILLVFKNVIQYIEYIPLRYRS